MQYHDGNKSLRKSVLQGGNQQLVDGADGELFAEKLKYFGKEARDASGAQSGGNVHMKSDDLINNCLGDALEKGKKYPTSVSGKELVA